MTVAPRRSIVDELRVGVARALEALADAARRRTPAGIERELGELRDRVEYLEDSLAAFEARAERDKTLRPWAEVRR